MSRPNRRKNNKKKRRASGAGTPTASDVSSSGAQASGEGGGSAAQGSAGSLPLSHDDAIAASEVPLAGQRFEAKPVASQEPPKPSPQKNPEPSPPNDHGSLKVTPTKKEAEPPSEVAAAASNQHDRTPIQSSAVKKTTIEGSAPTATAATSGAVAPSEGSKDVTNQTCACSLQ